jgi:FAD/FMN-containing dehydrogenase
MITLTTGSVASLNAITETVCTGTNVSITPVDGTNGTIPAGTSYTWTIAFDDGVTGAINGNSGGTGTITLGTLTNTTNSAKTVIYNVIPTVSGGCQGAAATLSITVNPLPQIGNKDRTICSGATPSITLVDGTDGVIPPGTTYSWVIASIGGVTGASGGNGSTLSLGTLVNTSTTAQSVVYTVTPSSAGCTGASFQLTVNVNPVPLITAGIMRTICSGESVTITPVNGTDGVIPAGTVYSWTVASNPGGVVGAVAANSGGTGTVSLGALTHNSATEQAVIYDVTPTSGSCSGSVFQITVRIKPLPNINKITTTVCNSENVSITPVNGANGVIPVGTTYAWTPLSSSGISGATSGNSGVSSIISLGTLTNTTTDPKTAVYEVTPSVGGCTGDIFQLEITVSPPITVTLISDNSFYWGGSSAQLTAIAAPAGTYTYDWYRDNLLVLANGGDTYISAEPVRFAAYNYHVVARDGSCSGKSNTVSIQVSEPGALTASLNYADICRSGTIRSGTKPRQG